MVLCTSILDIPFIKRPTNSEARVEKKEIDKQKKKENKKANNKKRKYIHENSSDKENTVSTEENPIKKSIKKNSIKRLLDDIVLLKEILIDFLKSRSGYSLWTANEAVLQAITEILLPNNRVSELCLVMNPTKPKYDGLIRGIKNNWNTSPTTEELIQLDKLIENENEATLLARNIMFWAKDEKCPKITMLNNILSSAKQQVLRYMKVIGNEPVQKDKP
ncbi:5015_t:CDS:2, partial [Racocetra persica]